MSESRFSSLMANAVILMERQQWQDALRSASDALMLARSEFGDDDKRLAEALEKQVLAFKHLGRDLDAERALHEATQIRIKHIRRRGLSFSEEHKYADAEKLYREALLVCERVYGRRHRETATCLDNLATCLRSQSLFVEATMHATRALDIRKELLGEDHVHTAASLSNVGYLYRLLGRFSEAQPLLVQSLVVREKHLGADHPHVAESLDRIASLCRDLGRFDEAAGLCERALGIRRASLGDEHPLTAASLNNLALIRERRSGDEVSVVAALPRAHDTAPPTIRTAAASRKTTEDHASGLGILAAVVVGAVLAAVAFWFVPWAGVSVVAVTGVVAILTALGVVPLDSIARRAGAWLKRSMAEDEAVDRDAVVLGDGGMRSDVAAILKKGVLTVGDARVLAKLDNLDLDHVHSLTQAAADALARQRGTLKLNGLRELRSKLAKSLRWHEGILQLNGVHELTAAAAAHIARHSGDLHLNGVRELSGEVTKHLAHHRGLLHLDGVRSLEDDAANWLIKHRGKLTLHGLRLVTRQTFRTLQSNPLIELPDDVGGQFENLGA